MKKRQCLNLAAKQGARHLCRFTAEKADRVGLGFRDKYRALKRPEAVTMQMTKCLNQ
jgi:hypothetical protein